MTLPTLLFALLISLLYGALYHFLRDGGFWRLVLYLTVSAIGFAIGLLIGWWQGWNIIPIGSLDLGAGSAGSLAALIAGDWLSRIQTKPKSTV